ncbi:MAG: hypothetical protein IJA82_07250 [Clostridia bacterium]|nr:hypothetical protein [Clostridia bacterium]
MKEKICNFECSEAELNEFLKNAEAGLVKKDFDAYSLDVILKCIDLYNNNKMTYKYLTLWVDAYAYLFEPLLSEIISKKELVLFEIADFVGALSYYEREQTDTLDWSIDTFLLYDSIFKELDKWELSYSITKGQYSDGIVNTIEAILVNHTDMKYILLDKFYKGDKNVSLEGNWLALSELNFYEMELSNLGFKKLKKF